MLRPLSLVFGFTLTLACGGSPAREFEQGLGAAGENASAGTSTAGTSGDAGSSSAGTSGDAGSSSAGSAGTSAGSTTSTAGTSGDAGTGGTSAGTGGTSAGDAGSSSTGGAAGSGSTGGSTPGPFSCPDPSPDDEIEWKVYTVQPGHCLTVGSSTWSGMQVCRETSPDDGTCAAECKNYLRIRVSIVDEPVRIAVMPLFGQVVESSSNPEHEDYSSACYQALEGMYP